MAGPECCSFDQIESIKMSLVLLQFLYQNDFATPSIAKLSKLISDLKDIPLNMRCFPTHCKEFFQTKYQNWAEFCKDAVKSMKNMKCKPLQEMMKKLQSVCSSNPEVFIFFAKALACVSVVTALYSIYNLKEVFKLNGALNEFDRQLDTIEGEIRRIADQVHTTDSSGALCDLIEQLDELEKRLNRIEIEIGEKLLQAANSQADGTVCAVLGVVCVVGGIAIIVGTGGAAAPAVVAAEAELCFLGGVSMCGGAVSTTLGAISVGEARKLQEKLEKQKVRVLELKNLISYNKGDLVLKLRQMERVWRDEGERHLEEINRLNESNIYLESKLKNNSESFSKPESANGTGNKSAATTSSTSTYNGHDLRRMLVDLKEWYAGGLISEDLYREKQREILGRM